MTLIAACSGSDPLTKALPSLPPTGGAALCSAGRLTAENFDAQKIPGPASQGLVGDYFMTSDKLRVIVQQPGRAIGPCPFGGNIIDIDRTDAPSGDQLGEVSAFLQLGRTIDWDTAEIVRDGSQGGPAVLRFFGHDSKDDFINIKGLGGFALAINDDYAADVNLGWRAAVTYILMPGETRVRIIYTFYNPASLPVSTLWGTLSDTGAGPEIFHPRTGFGELSVADIASAGAAPPADYVAFLGAGITYGIVPVLADRSQGSQSVPVAGVDVEAYQLAALGDAFGQDGQQLMLAAGGTDSREVDLLVGTDVGDVTTQALTIRGDTLVPVAGDVAGGAKARVAVVDDATGFLVTTYSADANGHFAGSLKAGTYRFQAEADGWRRGAEISAAIPGGAIALAVPDSAPLTYTVKDRAGENIPAKIIVLGAVAAPPDSRFRDVTTDTLPYGVANWIHSRAGDSSLGTRWDHPIALVPGRYRVVTSRGPEWSRDEQVLDVPAGGAHFDVVLDHSVPTPGYIAADFHQHSHKSPDAIAPPEDRLVSYLVDGGEYISSSDHDFLFDYAPVIHDLGAEDLITSDVGVETTAWDYGHYIGFPLTVDPNSPNGGAFDWGNGEGPSLTPPQIFAGLRGQGAEVVQVNHPRAMPSDFSSFQQSFDRAGLRFDFVNRAFFGDASLMPVSALILGVDPSSPMFAAAFDAHEIYNGFHAPDVATDGERLDQRVEINLRDWMNFLSFGFTPTPTGVSDSHEWIQSPGAMPRTLVRVADDSSTGIRGGLTSDVVDTVLGRNGARRDVIVTNAPLIEFTVDGTGIGGAVAHPSGPLTVHVKVSSPIWAPVDTVEIFSNNTFDIPLPKNAAAQPFVPVLCFTSKPTPSARCAMAIGGARPLTVNSVVTVAGVPSSTRLEAVADAADVTPDQILATVRAGAQGKDLWMVARAFGDTGLYPTIPDISSSVPIASDLVDSLILTGRGQPALAFTNAIFVDVDGGGWRGPFQP